MIQTGFESRIKVQQILESQLPEFLVDESPKSLDFFKQYYISQEYQGGPTDIVENLDQYLKLDNLTPEVIVGSTTLSSDISSTSIVIQVSSTKGFPQNYGLIKIDDEIITYTGLTTNTFTGCVRGFSGITNYHETLNYEELVFSTSDAASHTASSTVTNLSVIFLQEFYKKLKFSLTPGLENKDFVSNLNVGNFIKEARTLYESKGTEESFRILFNVLFGETPKVVDLENFLSKPSSASYLRRAVAVVDVISGNPLNLEGQTIFKTNDDTTTASVSEVEIIRRKEKTYYKLLLFIGYDDTLTTITGSFDITGSTKSLRYVSPNSSVITVDSTIGFPESGTIYSEDDTITYTSKSINQFYGCSGIVSGIATASVIRANNTYYGYENGDLSKKVELRITGVLSEYNPISSDAPLSPGEEIRVKNLGKQIKNPDTEKSYKEIFSNSWIYNTSSRYEIDDNFTPGVLISQFDVKSEIDKSSLKVGDYIDVLYRDSQTIIANAKNIKVTSITGQQVNTDTSFILPSGSNYDIRRSINTASSLIVPLEFDPTISDIQNVYDANDDEYMYVASNSLPSYQITSNIFSYNAVSVGSQNPSTARYSSIVFSTKVSFVTGNQIYYRPSGNPIEGLTEGIYYVEVLSGDLEIKLYASKQSIGSVNYLTFGNIVSGTHNFTLYSQNQEILSPQKILRKFPLSVNIGDGESELTIPGPIGMLVNGVEISGYKSNDKIYYGPLKSISILNGGSNYDVINPPLVSLSSGSALVQPVLSGFLQKIYVDPQDFDVDVVVSVALTGGKGSGSTFEPIIERKRREIKFDARQLTNGGGVDITNETITFLSDHGLISGQEIIYRSGSSPSLGIGTFGGSDTNTGNTLQEEAVYYPRVISNNTIQLYKSLSDYNSGINTVGFTTIGTSGIQEFLTAPKKTLTGIKVLNPGTEYTNRKLRVLPTGISTVNNTITFRNHGFDEGDLITYTNTTSPISGLSTATQYYVIKIDDNTFRLADAGIGGTVRSNYARGKRVSLGSTGSGYHIFSYPDISLTVTYSISGIGSTAYNQSLVATPVIRGKIIDAYVYNEGSDYGSEILNYHKAPTVSFKTGKNAQLKANLNQGSIVDVIVQYGGVEYYSTPDIIVSGVGTGAVLRPVIVNDKITDVIIVNPGVGYSTSDTVINVVSSGSGAILQPQVRAIDVNNNFLYNDKNDNTTFANEIIKNSYNNLQYTVCGYSEKIQQKFNDSIAEHSPIIGWAYDGNPIYGSYGYSNPQDINSSKKQLLSGYVLDTNNIPNRPSISSFPAGYFVEDYRFAGFGDLDEYNGRFCVTPEFPNGVYAYFATSVIDTNTNPPSIVGSFPYFIGNRYRSKFIPDNLVLDQSFDFNNSNLVRNTYPYKVADEYADNDFIIESNEIINQIVSIDSVTSGSVEDFDIIESGDDYKVGDILEFDENDTGGGGLIAEVSHIEGKEIVDLQTSTVFYDDAIFTWNGGNQVKVTVTPKHDLQNLDYVKISGFSTSLSQLNGFHQIGVTSYFSSLISGISSSSVVGFVTDIYISNIPENISIGSSIGIGTETLSVINIFKVQNIIRVTRGLTGISYTATTPVYFIPDTFTFNQNTSYFDSKINDLVYFNPVQSVGLGTTSGVGASVVFNVGVQTNNVISVPTQSIYLPNHPFKTNQAVTFAKPSSASAISVANTSTSTPFSLPFSGDTQTVYIIKKSVDYIGIVTQVGLTTSTDGLFFISNGSDNYRYYLQSNFTQIKGDVTKITSRISVSTSHSLVNGDVINLTVKPNLSVGIGTSTSIRVLKDEQTGSLLINPIGFSSIGINTALNTINIPAHRLNTGDKIKYDSNLIASGLSTGFYFVYKVDDNNIKLSETFIDCYSTIPPVTVSIASSGGSSHTIYPVNPELQVFKDNNVVFDLSDSSLSGYKFKIFYDNKFKDEFISIASTNTFSVSGVGTVGVASTARLTINYFDQIPSKLYYNIQRSGITTADTEVLNYCQITFVDSFYNESYSITGVGTTTFDISLKDNPERSSYISTECSVLKYTTTSPTETGGVSKIRLISPGNNYQKIPTFTSIDSESGNGASIVAKAPEVGKINSIRVINEGFEYSSDKTLRPEALLPSSLTLQNCYEISNVGINFGGANYLSAPSLIVVNSLTGEKVDSGLLIPGFSGSNISYVTVAQPPKGLPLSTVTIKAVNNTNGVGIVSLTSSTSGVITCILKTPLSGFLEEPFAVGDRIFVEGIEKYGSEGDGFNSENYGYEFFTVTKYLFGGTANRRQLEYNLSGVTTNPGIAKTQLFTYGSIVNYKNYPDFDITQKTSVFTTGESLEVKSFGVFSEVNSKVVKSDKNYLKESGSYVFEQGDIIRGSQSGSVATIDNITSSSGEFIIDYSSKQRIGWEDNIGKLNEDTQVIADNDYYQNLSYTIKSKQEWVDLVSPVNNLLHTSGLKNFADTEISNNVGVGTTYVDNYTLILYDIINKNRTDTINNYDLVLDYESSENYSEFLRFTTKKLADYIACKTNRVISIDDISQDFSNSDQNIETSLKIVEINPSTRYDRYLVQIANSNYTSFQLTEVIVLTNNLTDIEDPDIFTLERGSLTVGFNTDIGYTSNTIGDVYGYVDASKSYYLRFDPKEPYYTDYNVKYLNTSFDNLSVGVGTTSVGFIDLTSKTVSVGVGTTSSILGISTSKIKSIFSEIEIIDNVTGNTNYVEIFLDHDGTNTYLSEFYLDDVNETSDLSYNFIGSFGSSISGGILTLDYTNTSSNSVLVRAKNIGFGTTSVGVGTYRFKALGQPDNSEKTVQYTSSYARVSTASTIVSFDVNKFSSLKSWVKVSVGNTSALHQVLVLTDRTTNTYNLQYPFLSVGSTTGIGTFGTKLASNTASLIFYPDSSLSSGSFEILNFNQFFHFENDFIDLNSPLDLTYGNVRESVGVSKYFSINGSELNKLDFDLLYQGENIFTKVFNPEDTVVLDKATGIFSIDNHFFSTGEELIYTPYSTYVGVGSTAVGIGSTLNSVGIVTTILPSTVYAIKISPDKFKIATRKDYAYLGIGVTFTSNGSGNAHEFEMSKKNEKCIISIDNIIQSPLAYSLLNYTVNNGASIGIGSTVFALSGISSIRINDILKIDNEYMKVVNVGLGTTYSGPISFAGTFPLVNVVRGFAGTASTTHTNFSSASLYRGSFNIVRNKIYFTQPPQGTLENQLFSDLDELDEARSYFNGRVFFKNDYTSNVIYDNISENFTGVGQTYRLTVGGANTIGLGTTGGNGIVLINGIYQAPTTANNTNNNFRIVENGSLNPNSWLPYYIVPDEFSAVAAGAPIGFASNPGYSASIVGITSIVFSGITSTNGSVVVSPTDVNANQLPRGGIIVSLGSTPGLGYAPLVGARVKATIGAGGSITSVVGISYTGASLGIVTASYNNTTGIIKITTASNHYLREFDRVRLAGLAFTCPSGSGIVSYFPSPAYENYLFSVQTISPTVIDVNVGTSTLPHTYIGLGTVYPWYDLTIGSGYRSPISIAVTESGHTGSGATISATVGAGGTLSFNIVGGGTGYTNPTIDISPPNYSNLPITGVSRLSVGNTSDCGIGLLVNVEVGASSTTGIGSTLFEVTSFNIVRNGYSFRPGDVITPVGLVTGYGLSQPLSQFQITVLDTFSDSFSSWQFGELDYMDSIKNLQDGVRKTFPLIYNSQLLSFDRSDDADGELIDFDSLLVIFINGILQSPKIAYTFNGGTSFTFAEPPKVEDKVAIYFYRGSSADSSVSNIIESIKEGDSVQVLANNQKLGITTSQKERIVAEISNSDRIRTNLYTEEGIDSVNQKPVSWTKQKVDKVIDGYVVSKARDSLEPQIYPTAKIIKTFSSTTRELFVDDARFFNYEQTQVGQIDFDGLILPNISSDPVSAAVTAIVSPSGTISGLSIVSGGSGYTGASVNVSIAAPSAIGIGIGTTATATITVSASGTLTTPITITNSGFGYTTVNPPKVLVPSPNPSYENVLSITSVEGFSGIITGIGTTVGIGTDLALQFTLNSTLAPFEGLRVNYPIYIFDTKIGNGVTSIYNSNTSVIGIGTTFLDNIYNVSAFDQNTGTIICNILSTTSIVGLTTSGLQSGKISWGRLSGFTRSSSPISIGVSGYTVSGLSTFPTIQRRGYGLRGIGAIKKVL